MHYGQKQALLGISIDIPRQGGDLVHRAVGLRQVDVPALHHSMNDTIEGARVGGTIKLDGEDI